MWPALTRIREQHSETAGHAGWQSAQPMRQSLPGLVQV